MPTGYTAALCDGHQSFGEFVWRAVRAMGVFIHMRDDSMDTKLRLPDEDFYQSGTKEKIAQREAELRKEERELRDLKARKPKETKAAFEAYKAKAQADYEETYARNKPVADRLTQMRSQVADWKPPTPDHENFKKFMLQQLDETLRYDGRLPDRPVFEASAEEWHALCVEHMERYVARTKELLEEERGRTDSQKETLDWILALVDSVPPPAGRFAPNEIKKGRAV